MQYVIVYTRKGNLFCLFFDLVLCSIVIEWESSKIETVHR